MHCPFRVRWLPLLGLALLAATLGGKAVAHDYSSYTSWDAMDNATDAKCATVTRVSGPAGFTGFWFILDHPPRASVRSYSTHFQLDEDPISEGGKWSNGAKDGIDWYNVVTKNGVAYGAVSKGAYTDPTALLTGDWGRNQTVKAKVFGRNQTEKYYQEVEIRLRSTLTRQRCTGYEVFWRCLKTQNAYAEIVRWNGKVGDWTSLQKHTGPQYGVKDGDAVEATIVGNVIKGYVNGVEVISATDDTYHAGSPGMGFNFGVGESSVDFGFSYYEVDSYND